MSNFTTWRSLVDGEEISGIPDSVVDNFNDEDDAEQPGIYDTETDFSDIWDGSTAWDRVDNEESKVGDFALKGTSSNLETAWSDSVNRIPERGEWFQFWTWQTSDGRFSVALSDSTNFMDDGAHYRFRYSAVDGTIRITKTIDGSQTIISEESLSTTVTEEWVRCECLMDTDDNVEMKAFDEEDKQLATIDETDDLDFTPTHIGITNNNSGSATIYGDGIKVID